MLWNIKSLVFFLKSLQTSDFECCTHLAHNDFLEMERIPRPVSWSVDATSWEKISQILGFIKDPNVWQKSWWFQKFGFTQNQIKNELINILPINDSPARSCHVRLNAVICSKYMQKMPLYCCVLAILFSS